MMIKVLHTTSPYEQGRWPCIFLQSVTSFSPIACMRYRRGRPEGVPPLILCIAGIYDKWHTVVIKS